MGSISTKGHPRDENGIRIKPGHNGETGLPIGPGLYPRGPEVYILRRCNCGSRGDGLDDKVWGPFADREEAENYFDESGMHHRNKWEWMEIESIPIETFRYDDWVVVS